MLRALILEFGYECQNLPISTRIEGHMRSEKCAFLFNYQTLLFYWRSLLIPSGCKFE